MRRIGSQTRETLEESGMGLIKLEAGSAYLRSSTGALELWVESDDFAGYVIEIDGKGYEFAHAVKNTGE